MSEAATRAAIDRMARRLKDSAAQAGKPVEHETARREAVKIAKRHDRKQR